MLPTFLLFALTLGESEQLLGREKTSRKRPERKCLPIPIGREGSFTWNRKV